MSPRSAPASTPCRSSPTRLFKQAGIEIPDDKTWTWDKLQTVAAELTTKLGAGKYGINGGIFGDSTARAWMFQHGKSLFTDTGFGWEPADMQSFLELMVKFQTAKATPSAAEQAQDFTTALAQQLFGTGKTAMGLTWSNQIAAQQAATGKDLKILRLPSVDGTAKGASLWYKSGQYVDHGEVEEPGRCGEFLDYYFNNADAGKVMLAERGLPPNTDILTGIKGSSATPTRRPPRT